MIPTSSYLLLAASALLYPVSVLAHTWNEQLAVIGSNGQYVGGYGYSRGYVARTEAGYNGDSMLWLVPSLESGRTRMDSSDLACHPAQRSQNQTANYPRLQVAPGGAIAMKYLENGHVSLPQNQPGKPSPSRGSVYVLGTTQPIQDEKLLNILQWNAAGTGGDKRGFLLASNNFDDGRCHQINSGTISTQRQQQFPDPIPGQAGTHSELWCETDVLLPKDLEVGKPLTIYWVWDWPTAPGAPGLPTGKDEYYTTCSDLDVVAKAPSGPISNTLAQQDPMTSAVAAYAKRPAQTPIPRVAKDQKVAIPAAPASSSTVPAVQAPAATPTSASGTAFITSTINATPTSTITMPQSVTTAAPGSTAASTAPAGNQAVAVNQMLMPGQGLLVGADGMIFTFELPTDGGMSVGGFKKVKRSEPSSRKTKRDFEDLSEDMTVGEMMGWKIGKSEVEKRGLPTVPEAAMEVAGGQRFRMLRGMGRN